MKHAIIQGDVVEVCKRIADSGGAKSFDGVLCDPPYELGFMGKSWDSTGVAFKPETWAAILSVCKPGAHLMAFGGSRTMHRIVCAIEDGGWQIRDSLVWLYGSGFPKSLNLGDGYGTALKPAHEPIVLARAPLDGTVAANVTKWGCGALAIDDCRIECEPIYKTRNVASGSSSGGVYGAANKPGVFNSHPSGRWPANVLLDETAGQALDEQTGITTSTPYRENVATGSVLPLTKRTAGGYSDSGGASRFFYTTKAGKKERNLGLDDMPEITGGEATDREDGSAGLNSPRAGAGRTGGTKNPHPTVKPVALTEYLAKLILPTKGGRILIPFSGVGSEMIGAGLAGWPEAVGIEGGSEDSALYIQIANKRLAHWLAKCP